MRKPRTTFAAPFVLVVGCGHPADRPPPESPTSVSVAPADARPVDAACTIGDIACKPGKYDFNDDCKPQVQVRSQFRARVIRTWVIGDGLGVEIERPPGVDDPDSSWQAVFLDENGFIPTEPTDALFVVSASADRVTAQLYKTCTLPGTNVWLSARREIGAPPLPHMPCCVNPPQPRPPDPIEARVIGVSVEGGATLVTLDKGARDGVDRSWRATLGDPKIRCEVVTVTDRSTVCRLTATDVTATKAILSKD